MTRTEVNAEIERRTAQGLALRFPFILFEQRRRAKELGALWDGGDGKAWCFPSAATRDEVEALCEGKAERVPGTPGRQLEIEDQPPEHQIHPAIRARIDDLVRARDTAHAEVARLGTELAEVKRASAAEIKRLDDFLKESEKQQAEARKLADDREKRLQSMHESGLAVSRGHAGEVSSLKRELWDRAQEIQGLHQEIRRLKAGLLVSVGAVKAQAIEGLARQAGEDVRLAVLKILAPGNEAKRVERAERTPGPRPIELDPKTSVEERANKAGIGFAEGLPKRPQGRDAIPGPAEVKQLREELAKPQTVTQVNVDGDGGIRSVVEVVSVREIELQRAEGREEECVNVTVAGWAEAEDTFRRWARTAPVPSKRGGLGGYHKCDFKVTFADGETYSGRVDLDQSGDNDHPDSFSLRTHVMDHVTFLAGVRRPAHIDEATYERIIRENGKNTKKEAREFLAKYMGEPVPGFEVPTKTPEKAPASPAAAPARAPKPSGPNVKSPRVGKCPTCGKLAMGAHKCAGGAS
jgi:hypothetical protein